MVGIRGNFNTVPDSYSPTVFSQGCSLESAKEMILRDHGLASWGEIFEFHDSLEQLYSKAEFGCVKPKPEGE